MSRVHEEDVPRHRRAKGSKPYRLEMRVRPEILERSPFLKRYREWQSARRSYETKRDRKNALHRLRKSDRLFEYRFPTESEGTTDD